MFFNIIFFPVNILNSAVNINIFSKHVYMIIVVMYMYIFTYSVYFLILSFHTALSTGVVEYIDCISVEWLDLHLFNECPGYDIKPSDNDTAALEIWGMRSIPSLPLLTGPLWLGMVVPDRVLSMGQIELFDWFDLVCWVLWCINLCKLFNAKSIFM